MTRIVKFAVATAMRLDEICRVEWSDLDVDRRMLMIRDRKDPRNKTGNDQRIPALRGDWLRRLGAGHGPGQGNLNHTKGPHLSLQLQDRSEPPSGGAARMSA